MTPDSIDNYEDMRCGIPPLNPRLLARLQCAWTMRSAIRAGVAPEDIDPNDGAEHLVY